MRRPQIVITGENGSPPFVVPDLIEDHFQRTGERLIYPADMPFEEALRRSGIKFKKLPRGKAVAPPKRQYVDGMEGWPL